jgi:4-amino-4-deoxy-L-arabinose transferase-like glycosyltransferase
LVSWPRAGLGAILLLAAGLNSVGLDREGYGNTYYAAAVKSMLTSWPSFFFAAFDAGGYISVDKPPVGLWVQALSARLFGFSGLSLLLPQALAGTLSVGALYLMVRRAFGPAAGLLAALALAVTPISVVTNRNNTMDSQLILVLLLAAWSASLAAERGHLGWLLASAALVGLGYNIKMLQAFPILPGFGLAYLCAAPVRLRQRFGHLALAGLVLLVVALSWSLLVDLTPAAQRPYVGSSGSNSAISLALGYNGLGRLTEALAARLPVPALPGVTIDLSVAPAFAPGIGEPGLLRLFSEGLAGQASWLLPAALIGLAAASAELIWTRSDAVSTRRRRVALLIWGGWLVAWGVYFSVARFYHIYYLIMLGPPIGALAGAGLWALWRAYWRGGWRRGLLPLSLLPSAAIQVRMLTGYPQWGTWLIPLLLCGTLLAGVGLLRNRRAALAACATGLLVLFVSPTVWAAVGLRDGQGGAWLPQAGPSRPFGPASGGSPAFARVGAGPGGQSFGGGGPPGGLAPGQAPFGGRGPRGGFGRGGQGAFTFAGEQWNTLDPGLVSYLLANQGSARYLVATPSSSYASLFILATDQPALALGGYQGWDQVVSPAGLATMVSDLAVRFFLLPAASGFDQPAGGGTDATAALQRWVRARCAEVPTAQWQADPVPADPARGRGFGAAGRGQELYDCGAGTSSVAGS